MHRLIAFALTVALAIAVPASAQTGKDLTGTWLWQVEGHNAVILSVEAGPNGLQGTMKRPAQIMFTTLTSGLMAKMQMPVISVNIQALRKSGDAHELNYVMPDGTARQATLKADGKGGAEFGFGALASGAPTVALSRPVDPAEIFSGWDPARSYLARVTPAPSNPEMAAIFAADQADRKQGLNIDWKVVAPRDAARRKRVRELLDANQLRSGEDYFGAAFVFQHGDEADDCLLAHILAMAAQAQGHHDAAWIATATLDRYLQRIGKSQVLGTQFNGGPDGNVTQGAYAAELVPDSLRQTLGVPPRAQQEVRRKQLESASKGQ